MAKTMATAATLLSVLLGIGVLVSAQMDEASANFKSTDDVAPVEQYNKVVEPTLKPMHLEDLPGFTRSVVHKDHALITPESQVWAPLAGWTNTQAAYFITPALGAHFSMLLLKIEGNATSAPPSPGVERFFFVNQGEVTFTYGWKKIAQKLKEDSYAYAPPSEWHQISTKPSESAVAVIIERVYSAVPKGAAPGVVLGSTDEQPVVPVPGEVFVLRKLLPTGPQFDFNIHIMDFMPGEYLYIKEVHYNQHGLLLLEGRGIYRLADNWYPVQAGDVIWMAPFVPQWYAALGKTRSRYFLYKDTNRDPLL